ncbi:dienelactone hydrolase family protein [Methylomagnum sp.]
MTIRTRTVDYSQAGTDLEGFFAYDARRPKPMPAVLIAHAWMGRDEFVCDKAQKLAELGYAAFALDMYGKGVIGQSVEENAALMRPFMADRSLLQSRIMCALDTLRLQPEVDAHRIAAMGFCFGGLCVLDLARAGADIRGVASLHGLFIPPGNTEGRKIKARVLVLHGFEDPMATPTQMIELGHELTAAGADWQAHVYGNALHAFTNPKANDRAFGTVYDEAADQRSWQCLTAFFAEVLK